jgi:hypothetical protein
LLPDDARRLFDTFVEFGITHAKIRGLSLGDHPSTISKTISLEGRIDGKWLHSNHATKWNTSQIDVAVTFLGNKSTLTSQEVIGAQVQARCRLISRVTSQSYLDAEVMT